MLWPKASWTSLVGLEMKSYKQTCYQLLKNTNYKKAYMFFYTYLSKWDDFNSGSFRSRKQTKKLLTYFSIKITWDHIQGWEPVTIVWSDFVYWFQLFIIKVCTLMDDSTFASRRAHWELSFDIYISPFHQKCHLRPSGSHSSIFRFCRRYPSPFCPGTDPKESWETKS